MNNDAEKTDSAELEKVEPVALDDVQKTEKAAKPESMETEELDAASGSGVKEADDDKTSKPDAKETTGNGWFSLLLLIFYFLFYFYYQSLISINYYMNNYMLQIIFCVIFE